MRGDNRKIPIRTKFYKQLILFSFLLIFFKASNLGLSPASEVYKREGNKVFIKIRTIKGKRGEIYDRNLIPLTLTLPDNYDWKRKYPFGWITSNLIGFVNIDNEGVEGIEFEFNKILKGKDGKIELFRTADGNYTVLPESKIIPPQNGSDIILTIDIKIQKICSEVLKEYALKYRAKKGWVTVLNPQNGEILALSSYPFFDPENFYNYTDENYRNNNVQYLFEPGSVFKVLTAIFAIRHSKIKIDELFDVSKPIVIKDVIIEDPEIEKKKKNEFTIEDIIVYSSNIGISKISERCNTDELINFAKKCGFGTPTGILFPGEGKGLIKKKMNKVDLLSFSFGQGLLVTPLQIALFYSAIANDGYLLHPIILKGITKENKFKEFRSKIVVRKIFDNREIYIIKNFLRKVVEKGSGKKAKIEGLSICGKTGTSQKVINGKYSKELSVMSFVGFYPQENPNYLIYIGLDEPQNVRFSSEIIPEMFKKIVENIEAINGENIYEIGGAI
ncbi:MAG: penicillin-binding protein 2 [Candidatus Hydrothermales bacterium]